MKGEATNREIMTAVQGINNRLDILNGSVSKSKDKLANHDIIHAQMTLTQQQIVNDLIGLKDVENINSTYRIKAQASIDIIKYLLGIIGIGNIITLLKVFNVVQ